jgi:acetylornithine deacetylase/succinyl-diaminopimelate desuccinylase-like protein
MAEFLDTQLQQYGVETRKVDLGTHVVDKETLPLPPVILGRVGDDASKKTVLIYGHFDVQPVCALPLFNASLADCVGWATGVQVGWVDY